MQIMDSKCHSSAAVLCISALAALFAAVILVEMPMKRYTPENDNDIFSLLLAKQSSGHKTLLQLKNGPARNKTRMLFCTMLSGNFARYAAGAAKLAEAVHRDMPILSSHLNLQIDVALLEMAERPIPPKIWRSLQTSGWQSKITRPRIPPRNEGMEAYERFKDQFTKLHLWNMVQYDWVMYVDSDILVLRSFLPCIADVLTSSSGQKNRINIAAVSEQGVWEKFFNMGMFIIQPSVQEFASLLCKLHGTTSNCSAIPFLEPWMEQGLLNTVYQSNWTRMPIKCSMNLALWEQPLRDTVWRPNATSIVAIHFTMAKPWDWTCPWTQYASMCYLFWNHKSLQFHAKRDRNELF